MNFASSMSGDTNIPTPESTETPAIRVVSNSGPLIALATIGKLDLLKGLFGQIYIPTAVYDEVVISGSGRPGARETTDADWIKVHQVMEDLPVNLSRDELGAGESEAIVLARELEAAYLLMDDAVARRKAQHIGLNITGTLGVLLMAKARGLVSAIRPLLDDLRQTDFRMSPTVYREVLNKADEAIDASVTVT